MTIPADSVAQPVYLGGLLGQANTAHILNCSARGTVSTAAGSSSAAEYIGGLAGAGTAASVLIENSYSTAAVESLGNTGLRYAGSFIGGSAGSISVCYGAGSVTGGGTVGTSDFSADFMGDNSGSVANGLFRSDACDSAYESGFAQDSGSASLLSLTADELSRQTAYGTGTVLDLLNGAAASISDAMDWLSDAGADNGGYPVLGTAVTALTITGADAVALGSTLQLSVTVEPTDATFRSVTWSVANGTGSASVSSGGRLTPVSAGTVTVTASAVDGSGILDTHTVTAFVASDDDDTPAAPEVDLDVDDDRAAAAVDAAVKTNSDGTVTARVTSIQLRAAVEQASESAGTERLAQVVMDVDADDAAAITAVIPAAAFSSLTSGGTDRFTVRTALATVTLDEAALARIGLAGQDVTVAITRADSGSLTEEAQQTVGGRPVYSFSVACGGETLSSFGAGTAVVCIPYTPAEGEDVNCIVLYYVTDDGTLETVSRCIYDPVAGAVLFVAEHFSTYAVGYRAVSFTDVSGWAEPYISYLSARELMRGTDSGLFRPEAVTTRATLVTMLFRLAGEPGGIASNFPDVPAGAWYEGAAAWAFSAGIVKGTDGGAFSPDGVLTREQLAVMLYRYAMSMDLDVSAGQDANLLSCTDAQDSSEYALPALQWACGAGILGGDAAGALKPGSAATRAELAKMLAVFLQGTVA